MHLLLIVLAFIVTTAIGFGDRADAAMQAPSGAIGVESAEVRAPIVLAQNMEYPSAGSQGADHVRKPRDHGRSRDSQWIGLGVGIAVDLLTRPRDNKAETSKTNQPKRKTTNKRPGKTRGKAKRNPIVYVSLPNPAPLPSLRPQTGFAATSGDQLLGEFRPGEVIVIVATQAGPDAPAQIAQDFNLVLLRETLLELTGQRLAVFAIPDQRQVSEVEVDLLADARASTVQKNYLYRIGGEVAPGGLASVQYALKTMHVTAAHKSVRGRGAIIAVIDSAVASDHSEFAGAIAGSYDAAGYGLAEPDPHGTSVAGIIAARGGLVGVAPEAQLLAIRTFWKDSAEGPVTSSSEAIARAIDWAVSRGAQILNLSFTGPHDPLIASMLEVAHNRGVISIAAAGNNGPDATPVYPAALQGVIAVTATDSRDGLFALANRGAYVDIAAPGVDILSPAPRNAYQVISGTSMATAQISGLAALLIEALAQRSAGVDALTAAITGGARDLGAPGRDPEFGAGLADAALMLANSTGAVAAGNASSMPIR